jgi:hypothetical protein
MGDRTDLKPLRPKRLGDPRNVAWNQEVDVDRRSGCRTVAKRSPRAPIVTGTTPSSRSVQRRERRSPSTAARR